MKSFQRLIPHLILSIFLSACGAAAQVDLAPPPFVLITSAPDASPTPTPFQPSLYTPTQIPSLLFSTETPAPALDATATVDISQLFPTSAAPPADPMAVNPTALPPLTDKETINFLLIGSDVRSGSSFRTDSIMIAVVWPKDGQVSLISIPRDLWIFIPTVGMQRINTAYENGEINGYAGGGAGLLKDTISYNLGIRIDHTALVDFNGFRRIVDTLGGVQVPIGCAYTDWRLIDPSYDPYNENNWWLYTVGPGNIYMDGDLALWYARARSKSNDFDRGRRQQEVIRSIIGQALQTSTLGKIPQLYSDLSSTVVTDLGLTDIVRMAPYALNFTNANIRGYYIRPPYVTSWTTPGGAAVLLPDEFQMKQMLTEATTLSTAAVERQSVKVEVQNGVSADAWDALAAARLNYAGYQTVLANADRRNYANSILVDFTPAQDPNQRQTILTVLNLFSANVISQPDVNSPVQYRVILGYDYQPCFKPQDLSH